MRTLWKIVLPLLLLTLLLTLVACHSAPTDPPADSETSDSSESVTDGTDESRAPSDSTDGDESANGEDSTPEETDEPAETDPPFSDEDVVKAEPTKLSFTPTVTVKENGETATVTHESGLTYTAAGYTGVNNHKLTFKQGLTLTFDASMTAKDFNRFSLGYTSTQPLYATVTYTLGGKTVTDDFYLEAGTDTFSCVIGQYLNGKKGCGIVSMTFRTCNGKSADFALCALEVQDIPVYGVGADTYYIESPRFKLGIRLIWGGGINYLEDKNCSVSHLENLVNQADTGRLIQQSYYGVQENAQYKPSTYNGSTWCYNPVQGGDVAQNHSRIIDIAVNDYSVYVKSQPMDWAKDNSITPSYMENTYTVYADRIQVDNRFVDFSNWTHRYTHQELPAFYTVSYLSRFTLYNGVKPWTDDTMSYRDDLGFWGDSTYYNDCTFLLRNSNTETWCAWTNPSSDFGIGLYVPNVDSFLAGRHAFNNSKDSTDGATNYVAPVNTILLESFKPLEYSYLISTGSVEEMRSVFKENKDFTDNAALRVNCQSRRVSDSTVATNEKSYADLNKPSGGEDQNPVGKQDAILDLTIREGSSLLVATNNAAIDFHSSNLGTALTVKGQDPNVTVNYGGVLSANTYKTLEIVYMIPTTNSKGNGVADLFLCAGSITAPNADARVRVDLIADGQFHTLRVDLSGESFWTGDIHKLRFDFFDGCAAGDVMYVKSISFK